jgi:hypothetical protein
MAKPEGERKITFRIQDYFAAAYSGQSLGSQSISEEKIKAFCGGCDNLEQDNTCFTKGDQARYAERLDCGWASMGGVRGRMTIEGFIGPKNTKPPTP